MTGDEFKTSMLSSGEVLVGLRLPNSGEAILLSEADAEWLSNKLQDLGFGDKPWDPPAQRFVPWSPQPLEIRKYPWEGPWCGECTWGTNSAEQHAPFTYPLTNGRNY